MYACVYIHVHLYHMHVLRMLYVLPMLSMLCVLPCARYACCLHCGMYNTCTHCAYCIYHKRHAWHMGYLYIYIYIHIYAHMCMYVYLRVPPTCAAHMHASTCYSRWCALLGAVPTCSGSQGHRALSKGKGAREANRVAGRASLSFLILEWSELRTQGSRENPSLSTHLPSLSQ